MSMGIRNKSFMTDLSFNYGRKLWRVKIDQDIESKGGCVCAVRDEGSNQVKINIDTNVIDGVLMELTKGFIEEINTWPNFLGKYQDAYREACKSGGNPIVCINTGQVWNSMMGYLYNLGTQLPDEIKTENDSRDYGQKLFTTVESYREIKDLVEWYKDKAGMIDSDCVERGSYQFRSILPCNYISHRLSIIEQFCICDVLTIYINTSKTWYERKTHFPNVIKLYMELCVLVGNLLKHYPTYINLETPLPIGHLMIMLMRRDALNFNSTDGEFGRDFLECVMEQRTFLNPYYNPLFYPKPIAQYNDLLVFPGGSSSYELFGFHDGCCYPGTLVIYKTSGLLTTLSFNNAIEDGFQNCEEFNKIMGSIPIFSYRCIIHSGFGEEQVVCQHAHMMLKMFKSGTVDFQFNDKENVRLNPFTLHLFHYFAKKLSFFLSRNDSEYSLTTHFDEIDFQGIFVGSYASKTVWKILGALQTFISLCFVPKRISKLLETCIYGSKIQKFTIPMIYNRLNVIADILLEDCALGFAIKKYLHAYHGLNYPLPAIRLRNHKLEGMRKDVHINFIYAL